MAKLGSFHSYLAFGLQIRSEVVCLELQEGTGAPDVEVLLGKTPEFLQHPWTEGQFSEVQVEQFLFFVPEVGRFLVAGGRTITITPNPDADLALLRVFLLGSAFGVLLHQMGSLPLHGSALEGVRGAFVLTGPSGVGKSTLAATLHSRGLRVLSDDVCQVTFPEDGLPLLHPAYPRLHLRPDVLGPVTADPKALHLSRKAAGKFALDVGSTFMDRPLPVQTLFLLEVGQSAQLQSEELLGMAKVKAIAANTYRPAYLQAMQRLGSHFTQVGTLANMTRMYRIHRPPDLSGLQDLADLIVRLEARPPV